LGRFLADKLEVTSARDISQALVQLTNRKPDLIVVDLSSKGDISGKSESLAFVEHVLSDSRDTSVIATCGNGEALNNHDSNLRDRAMALGVLDVLAKPVDFAELEELLLVALQLGKPSPLRRLQRIVAAWMLPMVVFALSLVAWEILCKVLGIKEYLIPSPLRIAESIHTHFAILVQDAMVTAAETLGGFLLANIVSLIFAVGFCHSKWLERTVYPYIIGLKSVPIVAIAPLLVLWCGYGLAGKVIMAAITAFFPLVVNATYGLKAIEPEALDLMHSLSATKLQIFFKLRFPNALPHIFAALKISSTLAVVGAIVGELTGAKKGIGFTILMASYNIDTPLLFAAILAASLTGIAFFIAVCLVERLVLKDRRLTN